MKREKAATTEAVSQLDGTEVLRSLGPLSLQPPLVVHIPALNPFYSEMYISRHSVRSAPDGFAVIVNQGIQIVTLYPLPRSRLLEKIFAAFGVTAQQSDAGRVTTRLIRQMGSILACAVFKLQGVRRLIARHGPLKSFTRGAATRLIHDESGITERDSISSGDDVHLGNQKLTASAAFDFLLSRGVFRVGLELRCPHCTLEFWIAVDDLKSMVTCEYCGEQFLIAMQLQDRNWHYRRSFQPVFRRALPFMAVAVRH